MQPPENLSEVFRYIARQRWDNATEEDRERSRENGRLGGRPATCDCGTCAVCERRRKRQAKAAMAKTVAEYKQAMAKAAAHKKARTTLKRKKARA